MPTSGLSMASENVLKLFFLAVVSFPISVIPVSFCPDCPDVHRLFSQVESLVLIKTTARRNLLTPAVRSRETNL